MPEVKLDIKFADFIKPAFADKHKYTKIRAGRRTGKTFGGAQWIILMMMKNPGSKGLWVDTVQANISKYIERYFRPIMGKDFWKTVKWDRQHNVITFGNGSILDFGSAERPENMEGFEYDFGVLNEAGIILKKAGLWDNTLQPMFKNAQVKIIGTPKGKTDHKYAEMSDLCVSNPDEWVEYHYSCWDSPFWQQEQLESIKNQVPSYVWLQEYEAEHVDVYEHSMINMEDLRYYDDAELDYSQFQKVYMHSDTTHTGKDTSDYFCTTVMGEGKDRNFYLLDFVLAKMDEATQARATIALYQKWGLKVQKMTYDEKAHQGFGYWIKKLAKEEYGVSLPIEELNYPSDKVAHFIPHVPHFKANRVYLPKNHAMIQTATNQLLAFPEKDIHDDFVDGLSGALDNFNLGDRLFFSVKDLEMQGIRKPIREEAGWSYYARREPSHKYVIGCTMNAEASIVVIDATAREVVADYHNSFALAETVANELTAKGYLFNTAYIGVNADKYGASIVSLLKTKNYPSIYQNIDESAYEDNESDKLGVMLTPKTKGVMLTQLSVALKTIAIFTVSHTIKEDLLRYPRDNAEQLEDTYTRVVSLAIAYDMTKKSGFLHGSKITIS